jgi:hypothetical protein
MRKFLLNHYYFGIFKAFYDGSRKSFGDASGLLLNLDPTKIGKNLLCETLETLKFQENLPSLH